MTLHLQRVRRPFSKALEGFCSTLQARDLSGLRVCRMCSVVPLRTSALSGFSPLWDHPNTWVFSFCELNPTPSFMLFNTIDEEHLQQLRSPPVDVRFQRSIQQYVWLRTDGFRGKFTASFSCFEVRFEAHSFNNRWVPPCFLQGVSCHLVLNKLCSVLGRWSVMLLHKICYFMDAYVLSRKVSNILLVWKLLFRCFVIPVLLYGLIMAAPAPPPAPNILLKAYSVLHLFCSISLRFKFSRFHPPWKMNHEGLLASIRLCLRRPSSFICKTCCLDLKIHPVETVTRKPYGVVVDGTHAQVHPFYALVASCLRWKAIALCCRPPRLGLLNIK